MNEDEYTATNLPAALVEANPLFCLNSKSGDIEFFRSRADRS